MGHLGVLWFLAALLQNGVNEGMWHRVGVGFGEVVFTRTGYHHRAASLRNFPSLHHCFVANTHKQTITVKTVENRFENCWKTNDNCENR